MFAITDNIPSVLSVTVTVCSQQWQDPFTTFWVILLTVRHASHTEFGLYKNNFEQEALGLHKPPPRQVYPQA